MALLLLSNFVDPGTWREEMAQRLPDIPVLSWREPYDKAEVAMAVIDDVPPEGVLASLSSLKGIQYLGHGVANVLDRIDLSRGIAVARLVDPGIIEGVVEYCLGQILQHRWHAAAYRTQQQKALWLGHPVPLAADTRVGVLGLGPIGSALAIQLTGLGFQVSAWSRSLHDIEGVECHAGPDALDPLLGTSDFVAAALPETPETRGFFDAERLAAMKEGAYLINVGRGSLIDAAALMTCLDRGHLAGATLDVFHQEPLPPDHALWRHPKVTMTPHIAGARSTSDIETTAENYKRLMRGEPLLNAVT